MTILGNTSKKGDSLVTDVEVDAFLHELNLPHLLSKTIETLATHGSNVGEVKNTDTILNAIRYLIANLELNHVNDVDEWKNSDIIQYVKNNL